MSNQDQTNEILLEVKLKKSLNLRGPFLTISCPCCHTDLVFVKRDISSIVMCTLGTCKKLIKLIGLDSKEAA